MACESSQNTESWDNQLKHKDANFAKSYAWIMDVKQGYAWYVKIYTYTQLGKAIKNGIERSGVGNYYNTRKNNYKPN